jgi:hypothetical protein
MQNHAKHLSPFLCGLSIAIVCGVVALNPNGAHAFPEHLVLAFGQYTIYQSGVSDQVPVSVKNKWVNPDQLNMIYTAYDANNNLILSYNMTSPWVASLATFQDNVIVPSNPVPVRFYAEAQGIYGGDDQMLETQIYNFLPGGPFTFDDMPNMDEKHYKVFVAAVSPNPQDVRFDYTATGYDGSTATNLTCDPTFNQFTLAANQHWVGYVGIPVGKYSPVKFYVQVNGGAATLMYQLGKKHVKTPVNDLTVTQGPTVHIGDWTVPVQSQVTLSNHPEIQHQHVKVFFSAQDEGGNVLDCDPWVVRSLTYTPGAGGTGTLADPNGQPLKPVTVENSEVVQGRVTFTALLALYDNGDYKDNGPGKPKTPIPPTYVEPSSKLIFGP